MTGHADGVLPNGNRDAFGRHEGLLALHRPSLSPERYDPSTVGGILRRAHHKAPVAQPCNEAPSKRSYMGMECLHANLLDQRQRGIEPTDRREAHEAGLEATRIRP